MLSSRGAQPTYCEARVLTEGSDFVCEANGLEVGNKRRQRRLVGNKFKLQALAMFCRYCEQTTDDNCTPAIPTKGKERLFELLPQFGFTDQLGEQVFQR